MTASIVFQIVNTIVIPAWLILIFFPGKSWRNPVIYCFSMAMAVVYLVYVIQGFGDMDMESFSKLEGIKAMFSSDEAVLTGWVHYLVFDLLVGNWILNQSRKHGLNHFLIIPCLLLCFMFGPVGFLLYSILKVSKTKKLA
ncbi:ABA4-like family protein [Psychroflexus aestuariivivens]|uniref:ABA4-like family protein n=1 Tax=Psychroflexus aestuariivivens TaxID=1795040 RepID=UPI000FD84DC4|nr:ABA4-like family protein [Psychroflexus aestuariivivens]